MSQDSRKDLPPVTAPNFQEKVREALSTYLGSRGDKLDRGVTLRDLSDAGIVTVGQGYLRSGRGTPILGPGSGASTWTGGGGGGGGDPYVPDLTPPPTPTGFTATAAISNVIVECYPQSYSAGHGHGRSKLYGATWTGGSLPVFANAEVITEFQGNVASYATNPATTWHLWLTWVTVDGVESTVPAGGTNGVVVTTGQDVSTMLAVLAGEITASELHSSLGSRIDLVDAPSGTPGSVNARVLAEATTRASQTGDLYAQYTVKLDVDGKVSGYGLASTGPTGTGSTFEVRADKFVIAAPTGAAAGYVPFSVLAVPTVIGGITLPAGVYAQNAFIQDAQITSAKIANLAVDDAKIATMSVAKLTAGTMGIGAYIQSTNYTSGPSGTGFRINADGTAEMQAAYVRGQITASQIDSRGLSIKDAYGDVILSSGSSIQSQIYPYQYGATANQSDTTTNNGIIAAASTANWSQVYNNDGNRPANGATVGATFGVNIGGKITAGTASTYIDSLAVNTLQIANNAVTVPVVINYNPGVRVYVGGGSKFLSNIGVNTIGAGDSPVFVTGVLRFWGQKGSRGETDTWADSITIWVTQQYTGAQLFFSSMTSHRNEALTIPLSFVVPIASTGDIYIYASFLQPGVTGGSYYTNFGNAYYDCNLILLNMQGVKK